MEHEDEDDCDTNFNLCSQNNSQKFGKGAKRLINQRTSRVHPDNNIT